MRCHVNGEDVYPIDEEGFVILPSAPEWKEVPDHLVDQARAGARSCPERAIVLDETN
jgi:ferredoxin